MCVRHLECLLPRAHYRSHSTLVDSFTFSREATGVCVCVYELDAFVLPSASPLRLTSLANDVVLPTPTATSRTSAPRVSLFTTTCTHRSLDLQSHMPWFGVDVTASASALIALPDDRLLLWLAGTSAVSMLLIVENDGSVSAFPSIFAPNSVAVVANEVFQVPPALSNAKTGGVRGGAVAAPMSLETTLTRDSALTVCAVMGS
jgi:hypothetical protein